MNRLLQNAPNYYDDSNAFDHAEKGESKTAGRRLADFWKRWMWSASSSSS